MNITLLLRLLSAHLLADFFLQSDKLCKAIDSGSSSVLGVYKMPNEDSFHDKLKELYLKLFPEFSFSFFNAIFDKLIVYRTDTTMTS